MPVVYKASVFQGSLFLKIKTRYSILGLSLKKSVSLFAMAVVSVHLLSVLWS